MISNKDYSLKWHMNEYADTMLSLIDCLRGFLSKTKELDDSWMNKIVSSNGNLDGWAVMDDPRLPQLTL